MPTQTVIVPLGAKANPVTQSFIDSGKLKFVFSTTGGINPLAGPPAGHYYEAEGSKEELDEMVERIRSNC